MSGLWGGLHYRQSLASRVTILTTLAVGFAVSLVAFAAYATVRAQSTSALDDSLRERAAAAVDASNGALLSTVEVPTWVTGAADVKIAVVYADTKRAYYLDRTVKHLDIGRPELAVAEGRSHSEARTVTAHGTRYRMVTVPAGNGQALVLAQSTEPTDRMLDRLGLVALLFGLAGMIIAGLAGWAVARNGLRPVRRLTTAVEEIARTERLTPIPVDGDDEVARLASAFNGMLTALSASQARQRQLVADASHELRTPLTSLRTNLDLLVQADTQGGLSPESRRELLDDVRAQINEMTQLIGDLVELARDEPVAPTVEPVDLAEVVQRAVDRARRRSINGVQFEVAAEPVVGDRRGGGPRTGSDEPPRQLGEVESSGRHGAGPARGGHPQRRRRGQRHRRGGPSARVRPVLPVHRVPQHARLGARPVHRPVGRRPSRRTGARHERRPGRGGVLAAAPGRGHGIVLVGVVASSKAALRLRLQSGAHGRPERHPRQRKCPPT